MDATWQVQGLSAGLKLFPVCLSCSVVSPLTTAVYCVCVCRRLLGIITKKDVLRHVAQMKNQDPDSILFN